MKVCELLEEFEFLPSKEKQRFIIKAWKRFHSEISDEEFMKEFVRMICNNKSSNNTSSMPEDIIQKMKGAQ
jgi:hypothetical protein